MESIQKTWQNFGPCMQLQMLPRTYRENYVKHFSYLPVKVHIQGSVSPHFSLSPGALNRTSFHICGSLIGVGSLTLINMASFIVLVRLSASLATMLKWSTLMLCPLMLVQLLSLSQMFLWILPRGC